jgi:DNA-directed RNA polymerase subunit RPC12/RpoP
MKTMQKHNNACDIKPVGKRRDGGTRYWCLAHKADATAKYGRRAKVCRAAHLPPILPEEILELDLDQYRGGVALWGAVPPVYDTTRLPLDFGIHVHARKDANGDKVIDHTYRGVRLIGRQLPSDGLLISEIDAVYYMVSGVFGFDTRHVRCTYCGYPHLDKDWFSIHPHRRHLCAGCGRNFRDTISGIGNPIRATQEILGLPPQKTKKAAKTLSIRQRDYQVAYKSGAPTLQSFGPPKNAKRRAFMCMPTNEKANCPTVTIPSPQWR